MGDAFQSFGAVMGSPIARETKSEAQSGRRAMCFFRSRDVGGTESQWSYVAEKGPQQVGGG